MTNLKTGNIGWNKYCGPAVLSILTGKSTDECARVISSVNGQYNVTGVYVKDLLLSLDKLGFDADSRTTYVGGSRLFKALTFLIKENGIYVISIRKPEHYVVVEVNNKSIYFCDNHTREPIPAASSARMMQQVDTVHKVIERKKKVCKTVTKTIKQELTLSYQDIYEALLMNGNISPKSNVRIYFSVPRGGDYSGIDIDIDKDNPIKITEEYTETEQVEVKDADTNY